MLRVYTVPYVTRIFLLFSVLRPEFFANWSVKFSFVVPKVALGKFSPRTSVSLPDIIISMIHTRLSSGFYTLGPFQPGVPRN